MQRREFAKKTLTAIAATSILGTAAKAQSQSKSPYNASDEEILNQSSPFKCKFAANLHLKGDDWFKISSSLAL